MKYPALGFLLLLASASFAATASIPFHPTLDELEKYAGDIVADSNAPTTEKIFAVRLDREEDKPGEKTLSEQPLQYALKDQETRTSRRNFKGLTPCGNLTLARAEALEFMIVARHMRRAAKSKKIASESRVKQLSEGGGEEGGAPQNGFAQIARGENAAIDEQKKILERLDRVDDQLRGKLRSINDMLTLSKCAAIPEKGAANLNARVGSDVLLIAP